MFDVRRLKKIFIFAFVMLVFLFLTMAVLILGPFKHILDNLNKENKDLQAQLQNQNKSLQDFQTLKNKLIHIQKLYQPHLQKLKYFSNLSLFYSQLSQTAHAYHLSLLELKPKESEQIADLKKQIISLEISGAEKSIWFFLQALCHHPGVVEIVKIELKTVSTGVNLQALLAVYYAPVH